MFLPSYVELLKSLEAVKGLVYYQVLHSVYIDVPLPGAPKVGAEVS